MNNALNPIRISPAGKSSGNQAMEFIRHAMLAHLKQEPGTPKLNKQAPLVPPGIGPTSGGQGVTGLQGLPPVKPLKPLKNR